MKFVIPNFFTLSNLIIGFICIINIFNNPTNSTVLYLFYLCLILDFLDGFFARKFNVVSEFGKQLGKTLKSLKKASNEFQNEIDKVMQESDDEDTKNQDQNIDTLENDSEKESE